MRPKNREARFLNWQAATAEHAEAEAAAPALRSRKARSLKRRAALASSSSAEAQPPAHVPTAEEEAKAARRARGHLLGKGNSKAARMDKKISSGKLGGAALKKASKKEEGELDKRQWDEKAATSQVVFDSRRSLSKAAASASLPPTSAPSDGVTSLAPATVFVIRGVVNDAPAAWAAEKKRWVCTGAPA